MKKKNYAVTSNVNEIYNEVSKLKVEDLMKKYQININGLTEQEVEDSLDLHGENVIDQIKEKPWYVYLVKAFFAPFSAILILISIILFFTDVVFAEASEKSYSSFTIILAIVTISSLFEFFQNFRANKAAAELKDMVSNTIKVRRNKNELEIPIDQVVIGDIIILSAGDMIPADVRIISNKDLFVGQSSLTGESAPVEKYSECSYAEITGITDLDNICFMGTNIISGTAVAVVVATGSETYFGKMANTLLAEKSKTSFEKGIDNISKLLIRFVLIMAPVIFLTVAITKKDVFGAFLFAVSIAVGITPELLPMILASTLGKGAITMAKNKTIVKNMNSIQSFGAMDILCTDKTGTLTEDKIILEKYLDVHGNPDERVLRHAFLNSYFQTGLKSNIDIAVIERANNNNLNNILENYQKEDEIPFDFSRRKMSVVLKDKTGKRQLITKGAVEEMLETCSFAEYKGEVLPTEENLKQEAIEMAENLNKDGLRVVAIAQKNEIHDVNTFGVNDEKDMVLIGFVGFLDPPKESAKYAIKALNKSGVKVIVLTGDNEYISKKVCGQVGIPNENIILGNNIDELSDEELFNICESTNILAKLSPMQKLRVINVLQANGHVVGYMGDGINDAPALNNADVGISVDSAVDIAKESADIILLEKDLMVLEKGIISGRKTFGNLIKYVKMAVSSNFGNMFSVLAASIFLPFLPITPVQILAQNLLYDISQVTIPTDKVDKEYILNPKKWDARGIKNFTLYMGPLSSIFDIIIFIILYFLMKANSVELASIFQTGWFLFGLVSQTLVVHLIRTPKLPFIQSRASKSLTISTLIIVAIALVLPFTGVGAALGLVHIPLVFYAYLFATILLYGICTQVIKKVYVKKYNEWI